MFTQVKTSKENKDIVVQLTRKLNLGTENVIARMAFAYSLSLDRQLNLDNLLDSTGKEYSRSVLFGDYYDIYIGMLCVHYGIYKTNKDLVKYVKLHLDDGLILLNEEFQKANNIDGFDFLLERITSSIEIY
ncbi:DndE family protein [Sphingobacterium sp.]|uniref:DndE family protein n=1 Tax=Sphingobacterium sp. TaxID=341027 RepID=UPI00289E0E7D|nr:DndE family protein [Sphingobacterium sp.]